MKMREEDMESEEAVWFGVTDFFLFPKSCVSFRPFIFLCFLRKKKKNI